MRINDLKVVSGVSLGGFGLGIDPMELRRLENIAKREEAARQARIELYKNKVHGIAKEMSGQITYYDRNGEGKSYDYNDFDAYG